jgi:cation-transporting ATPase E
MTAHLPKMTNDARSTGLSAAEVAERTARGEVNRVRRSDAADYRDIVARNTLTLFNFLVVPAAVALFLLGEWGDAWSVSAMILANTILGLAQEIRAKRHLEKLALLAETKVRVVRDGRVSEVATGDVVRGDYVLLAAGDSVVADGTVQEARYLEIDEALLTGESDPVPRRGGDRVLSGSFCVAGEGAYVAEQVGAAAFVQRTAAEARAYRYTRSPLQQGINGVIRLLTYAAVGLCAAYVVLYSARDLPERDLVKWIAATITSMVPQGLVLMVTLAFILGAVRLARRGAVVQRLSAVESMAAVDTLCMDKTGTLTTNRLHLERLEVVGPGRSEQEVRRLLQLFAAASADHGSKSLAALRAALGPADAELIDFLPFKSQNRFSAVRVRAAGEVHALVLGAPEALQPLVDGSAGAWQPDASRLLGTGLRLLLFAEAHGGRERFEGSLKDFRLRPLALVALGDELRPEAAGVLRELADQGLGFKILSGDNAQTVRATVEPLVAGAGEPALQALAAAPVVTGAELEAAADAAELIDTRSVFGRVSPWQKVQIVTALKGRGRHVAMIGDGVNDVLPIKNAQLGIAMGEGSRAAKTVSGMVLETNDFSLLPAALGEGRTILRNVGRAGKLFLVKNVYTVILIVLALFVLDLPFPYLPRQVTLLNFLTIGAPALLIMLGRERGGRASGGPRRVRFLAEVGSFVLRTGLVLGAAGVVLMLQARAEGEEAVRTQLLTGLVLLGIATLLRALRDGEDRRVRGDAALYLVAAAAVPFYLITLYWPLTARFFDLTPLTVRQWGQVLVVVVPALAVLLLTDWLLRPRRVSRLTATSAGPTPGGLPAAATSCARESSAR